MTSTYNVRVDRILGRSSAAASLKSGQCTAFSKKSGLLAYAAGCVLVVKNLLNETTSNELYLALPRTIPIAEKSCSTPTHMARRGSLSILSFEDFAEPSKGKERTKSIVSVAISPDGRWLACGEQGQAPRICIWDMRSDDFHLGPSHIINVHSYGVKHLSFSASSSFLASVGYLHDGTIHVWELRNGVRKVATNRVTANVKHLIWVGNKLLTVGTRHVRVWQWKQDSQQKARRSSLDLKETSAAVLEGRNVILGAYVHSDFICSAVLDGRRALIATAKAICVVGMEDKQPLQELVRVRYEITTIHVDQDFLLLSDTQGRLRRLSLPSSTLLPVRSIHVSAPDAAHFGEEDSPIYVTNASATAIYTLESSQIILAASDGSTVLCGQNDQHDLLCKTIPSAHGSLAIQHGAELETYVAQTNGTLLTYDENGHESSRVVLSRESITAATVFDQNSVLFGTASGTISYTTTSFAQHACSRLVHDGEICQIVLNRATNEILSFGRDRMLQLCQLVLQSDSVPRLSVKQTFNEHTASITNALFMDDCKIISSSADRTIHIRSRQTSSGNDIYETSRIIDLRSMSTSMAVLPSKSMLVISCLDKTFLRLNVETGCIQELCKAEDNYDFLAVNASAAICCCVCSAEKTVCLRSLDTGALISNKGYAHIDRLTSVQWSKDRDDLVITTSYDGMVVYWWFDSSEACASPSTPIRKIKHKVDPHRHSFSNTNGIIRRSSSVPRLPGTPSRALSPSKLGYGQRSPSPKRPASSCNSAAPMSSTEAASPVTLSVLVSDIAMKLRLLESRRVDLDQAQKEELYSAALWMLS